MVSTIRIRDIAQEQRPRERLIAAGASALSDAELLALQLGTGSRDASALDLANDLLVRWGGAAGLARAEAAELARATGVGTAKAARIVSAFALGRRASAASPRMRLDTSMDIVRVARPLIGVARQEHLLVLVADGASRVQHTEVVAKGSAKSLLIGCDSSQSRSAR